MTDDDIKTLARDIASNRVFTDRHIENPRDFPMVFMVLAFMGDEQHKEFTERDVGMVYEYMDKAGPTSCNGMPCFFSLQIITKAETIKVFEHVKEFEEFWGKTG